MAFDILYGRHVVLADDTSSIKNIHKIASAKGAADPNIECLNSINNLHMGQFLQGGKNGRLMSFFLK